MDRAWGRGAGSSRKIGKGGRPEAVSPISLSDPKCPMSGLSAIMEPDMSESFRENIPDTTECDMARERDPVSLSTVVSRGDRRRSLEAIRDRLAELFSTADERAAPALAQRLVAVLAELDSLPGGREVSKLDRLAAGVVDDLATRRAHRVADATRS